MAVAFICGYDCAYKGRDAAFPLLPFPSPSSFSLFPSFWIPVQAYDLNFNRLSTHFPHYGGSMAALRAHDHLIRSWLFPLAEGYPPVLRSPVKGHRDTRLLFSLEYGSRLLHH